MLLRGTPELKIRMLCVLSQKYQHFLKNNICILDQIVQETQKWL